MQTVDAIQMNVEIESPLKDAQIVLGKIIVVELICISNEISRY